MADTKKVATIRNDNRQKAVEAHAGFVSFVTGKVKKHGIEKVLTSPKVKVAFSEPGEKKPEDLYWLKQAYQDVLDFAKEVQLKEMPQKNEHTGEDGGPVRLVFRYTPDLPKPKAG